MSEPALPEKRPTGAAVTAALTPFMGGPVAFALFTFALRSGGHEEGLFGQLAEAWAEGGFFMYVVLLVGGGVAMTSAALMFFGVQRGSPAVLAAAPLGALITAVGAVGFFNGISSAAQAVAHVNPADRATIMAAGTGEALTTSAFGLAGTAGLLASLSLGCLFGVAAQNGLARKLLVFTGAAFLSLSLVSATALLRLSNLMGLFKALAHVNPLDRPTILVMGSEELGQYRLPMLSFLALVLAVLVAGAMALKESPRTAVLLVLLGAGGLVGLGAQAGASSLAAAKTASLFPADAAPMLIELDGYSSSSPQWCLAGLSVRACEEDQAMDEERLVDELSAHVRNKREYSGEETVSIPLGITAKSTPESLWMFVGAAVTATADGVLLTGQKNRGPLKVVSELAAIAPLMQSNERSVPVGFAIAATPCEKGCELGKVDGDALIVDGKRWQAEKLIGERSELRDDVRVKVDMTMGPERLVTLALAAASNGRRLVIELPMPTKE